MNDASPVKKVACYAMVESNCAQSILGTALFRIEDKDGRFSLQIRGLCDNGSQKNLITKDCAQRLMLPRLPSHCAVVGAGVRSEIISFAYTEGFLCHASLTEKFEIVRFHIVPKISCNQPQNRINCDLSLHLASHQLADPYFGTPARLDAIIGVGTWASIARSGIIRFDNVEGNLIAQNSSLGWIISGSYDYKLPSQVFSYNLNEKTKQDEINLERFWEINDGPTSHVMTESEERVENNFIATHQLRNGRYVPTKQFL